MRTATTYASAESPGRGGIGRPGLRPMSRRELPFMMTENLMMVGMALWMLFT